MFTKNLLILTCTLLLSCSFALTPVSAADTADALAAAREQAIKTYTDGGRRSPGKFKEILREGSADAVIDALKTFPPRYRQEVITGINSAIHAHLTSAGQPSSLSAIIINRDGSIGDSNIARLVEDAFETAIKGATSVEEVNRICQNACTKLRALRDEVIPLIRQITENRAFFVALSDAEMSPAVRSEKISRLTPLASSEDIDEIESGSKEIQTLREQKANLLQMTDAWKSEMPGDLPESFKSLIETWHEKATSQAAALNQLLTEIPSEKTLELRADTLKDSRTVELPDRKKIGLRNKCLVKILPNGSTESPTAHELYRIINGPNYETARTLIERAVSDPRQALLLRAMALGDRLQTIRKAAEEPTGCLWNIQAKYGLDENPGRLRGATKRKELAAEIKEKIDGGRAETGFSQELSQAARKEAEAPGSWEEAMTEVETQLREWGIEDEIKAAKLLLAYPVSEALEALSTIAAMGTGHHLSEQRTPSLTQDGEAAQARNALRILSLTTDMIKNTLAKAANFDRDALLTELGKLPEKARAFCEGIVERYSGAEAQAHIEKLKQAASPEGVAQQVAEINRIRDERIEAIRTEEARAERARADKRAQDQRELDNLNERIRAGEAQRELEGARRAQEERDREARLEHVRAEGERRARLSLQKPEEEQPAVPFRPAPTEAAAPKKPRGSQETFDIARADKKQGLSVAKNKTNKLSARNKTILSAALKLAALGGGIYAVYRLYTWISDIIEQKQEREESQKQAEKKKARKRAEESVQPETEE